MTKINLGFFFSKKKKLDKYTKNAYFKKSNWFSEKWSKCFVKAFFYNVIEDQIVFPTLTNLAQICRNLQPI